MTRPQHRLFNIPRGSLLFLIIFPTMHSQISRFPRGKFSTFAKQDGVIPKCSSFHFVCFGFNSQRFFFLMYREQMRLCGADKCHRLFQGWFEVATSNKEKNGQLYGALFEGKSIIGSEFYLVNGTIPRFKNSGSKEQSNLLRGSQRRCTFKSHNRLQDIKTYNTSQDNREDHFFNNSINSHPQPDTVISY